MRGRGNGGGGGFVGGGAVVGPSPGAHTLPREEGRAAASINLPLNLIGAAYR